MKKIIILIISFFLVAFASFYAGYSVYPYSDDYLELLKFKNKAEFLQKAYNELLSKYTAKTGEYSVVETPDGPAIVAPGYKQTNKDYKIVPPVESEPWISPTP